MSASRDGLSFDFEWRITLFTALVFPILLGLGFWQMARAQEKTELLASWDTRQNQAPIELAGLFDKPPEELAYLSVSASGTFLQDRYFLLDNRIQGGVFGYEVLGVFRLAPGGDLVLINRGWVPGDPARRALPEVPPVTGEVALVGHVYIAPGAPYLLAEQELDGDWPKLLQAVEMDKIVPQLELLSSSSVFPYLVRINPGEPGAMVVDWQVVNVSPDKHRAYATQWFTMAVVLMGFYLVRSSNVWQLIRR